MVIKESRDDENFNDNHQKESDRSKSGNTGVQDSSYLPNAEAEKRLPVLDTGARQRSVLTRSTTS
jgi:hypothetical protein